MNRPQTLTNVSDELLAEFCLFRGGAIAAAYRCCDPNATLSPLAGLTGPMHRKLDEAAGRRLLQGVRDGDALPPSLRIERQDPHPPRCSMVCTESASRWRSASLRFLQCW